MTDFDSAFWMIHRIEHDWNSTLDDPYDCSVLLPGARKICEKSHLSKEKWLERMELYFNGGASRLEEYAKSVLEENEKRPVKEQKTLPIYYPCLVGDIYKQTIADKTGAKPSRIKGCSCNELIAQMNQNGIRWNKNNRDYIVDATYENIKNLSEFEDIKLYYRIGAKVAPKSVVKKELQKWLDQAIETEEKRLIVNL